MLRRNEEIVGRFVLLGLLGRGGFGSVWRASDKLEGGEVAIKFADPEVLGERPDLKERFERTARELYRIRDPRIARVVNLGAHRSGDLSIPFVAFEMLSGETLREAAESADVRTRFLWYWELLNGAAILHSHGVVHRDLKPENVMVSPDPGGTRVTIIDFDLAKVPGSHTTVVGSVGHTPDYAAPEQRTAKSSVRIGPATDVYALGVMLFELLSGRPPSDIKLASRHESLEARCIPLATLLARCIEEAPAARYPDASALRDAIATLVRTHPPEALGEALRAPVAAQPWQTLPTPQTPARADRSKGATPPKVAAGPARTPAGGRRADASLESTKGPGGVLDKKALAALGGALVLAAIGIGVVLFNRSSAAVQTTASDAGAPPPVPPMGAPPASAAAAPATLVGSGGASSAVEASPNPISPDSTAQATAEPSTANVGQPAAGETPSRQRPTPMPHSHVHGPVPAPPASTETGVLKINSTPWSQVYVDNRLFGNTPQTRIVLPAGMHQVVLRNPDFDIRESFNVVIEPGQTVTRVVRLEVPSQGVSGFRNEPY